MTKGQLSQFMTIRCISGGQETRRGEKCHLKLKRLFDRSIYHRAILFGNRSTPFLKTTLATKTIMRKHIPIVIWVCHRIQKRIARVLARSRFLRRPWERDNERRFNDEVDTGYPKNGLRTDVADSRDNGTVEDVETVVVWSSDGGCVDTSRDCCSGCTGSSRFANRGRVPP